MNLKRVWLLIGIAVGMLACLLILIALPTRGWLSYGDAFYGLLTGCIDHCTSILGEYRVPMCRAENINEKACNEHCSSPFLGAQKAVVAFVMIGFVLTNVGLGCAIYYYYYYVLKTGLWKSDNKRLSLAAAICHFVGGAFCMLGAMIWATKVKEDLKNDHDAQIRAAILKNSPDLYDEVHKALCDAKLGYSFALEFVGALLDFVAGAFIMFQRSRGSG